MKKISLVLLLLITLLNFTSCKKEQPVIINYEGLINFLAGDVKIIADGKTVAASIGDTIKQGMTIKTGPKSVVDIYFNENVIRILENSSVVMTELVKNVTTDRESSEFYVENGQLFSKVKRKLVDGEKFRVSTPTSVAGVRGTEFLVQEENGKSTVGCIEGVVIVKESGSDDSTYQEVEAGKEANLEKGGTVSIADLKERNRQNIQKIKDDIRVIREDIRKRFEEKREEIRKKVEEQKEANKKMIDEQRASDLEKVQAIKDSAKVKSDELKESVNAEKEELRGAVKNFDKPDVKNVKPEIKSFKKEQ